MSRYCNYKYSRSEIEVILSIIQECIVKNHFSVSKNKNRQENIEFIKKYNLTIARQKDILLKIEPEDFCYAMQNKKQGFHHEILYVFCPQILLFNFDGKEDLIDIYVKFNIIEYEEKKHTVVISFHQRNKKIDYQFR